MKITIKNQEVELKNKMRVYLIFEELSGKSFAPSTLMDMLIYLYSIILGNSKDIDLTFDELLDYVDENPQVMEEFKEWIEKEYKKREAFKKKDEK